MNFRMQLSPISGIHPPAADVCKSDSVETLAANLDDARFMRSWLIYDSDLDLDRPTGRVNWNMVLGLIVAAVVSASFWVGAGALIARFWK
jgi:hypothetical protein